MLVLVLVYMSMLVCLLVPMRMRMLVSLPMSLLVSLLESLPMPVPWVPWGTLILPVPMYLVVSLPERGLSVRLVHMSLPMSMPMPVAVLMPLVPMLVPLCMRPYRHLGASTCFTRPHALRGIPPVVSNLLELQGVRPLSLPSLMMLMLCLLRLLLVR
jgi:hypothetical protein